MVDYYRATVAGWRYPYAGKTVRYPDSIGIDKCFGQSVGKTTNSCSRIMPYARQFEEAFFIYRYDPAIATHDGFTRFYKPVHSRGKTEGCCQVHPARPVSNDAIRTGKCFQ
jgi:hypothetical protein